MLCLSSKLFPAAALWIDGPAFTPGRGKIAAGRPALICRIAVLAAAAGLRPSAARASAPHNIYAAAGLTACFCLFLPPVAPDCFIFRLLYCRRRASRLKDGLSRRRLRGLKTAFPGRQPAAGGNLACLSPLLMIIVSLRPLPQPLVYCLNPAAVIMRNIPLRRSYFRSARMRLFQSWLQVQAGWKDALSASVAAGLAWTISYLLLGHPRPVFAAMGAIISLAPGLANHGKQAMHLFIGVTTGVLIGEFALVYFAFIPTEIRIVIVCFLAMICAVSYAIVPLMAIQSGLSAIMVFALGPDMAGIGKIEDIAIGTGLGIIFSQVLFTPDPRAQLRLAAELFFRELAGIYVDCATALANSDKALARQALQNCNRVHSSLIALSGSVTSARESTVWSLRGLIFSRQVTSLAAAYNRAGIRLYAATLLLCEGALTGLKKANAEQPPGWFEESLLIDSDNCHFLAGEVKGGDFIRQNRAGRSEPPLAWADCANSLMLVENTLARFYKSKSRHDRLAVFTKKRQAAKNKGIIEGALTLPPDKSGEAAAEPPAAMDNAAAGRPGK